MCCPIFLNTRNFFEYFMSVVTFMFPKCKTIFNGLSSLLAHFLSSRTLCRDCYYFFCKSRNEITTKCVFIFQIFFYNNNNYDGVRCVYTVPYFNFSFIFPIYLFFPINIPNEVEYRTTPIDGQTWTEEMMEIVKLSGVLHEYKGRDGMFWYGVGLLMFCFMLRGVVVSFRCMVLCKDPLDVLVLCFYRE